MSFKNFFLFKPVKKDHVVDLHSTEEDMTTTRGKLRQIFALKENSKENEIILDLHYMNYQFSRQQNFSVEKISCFLGLMGDVFSSSMIKRFNNDRSFRYMKETLIRHSIQRPPKSIEVFSLEDIRIITDFVLRTFYQHYNLYLNAFTPKVDFYLESSEKIKISLPPLPSLDKGNPVDPLTIPDLDIYVARPPTPQDQVSEKEEEQEESQEVKISKNMEKMQVKINKAYQKKDQNFINKLDAALVNPEEQPKKPPIPPKKGKK